MTKAGFEELLELTANAYSLPFSLYHRHCIELCISLMYLLFRSELPKCFHVQKTFSVSWSIPALGWSDPVYARYAVSAIPPIFKVIRSNPGSWVLFLCGKGMSDIVSVCEENHTPECFKCGQGGILSCCEYCHTAYHPSCLCENDQFDGAEVWICPLCAKIVFAFNVETSADQNAFLGKSWSMAIIIDLANSRRDCPEDSSTCCTLNPSWRTVPTLYFARKSSQKKAHAKRTSSAYRGV